MLAGEMAMDDVMYLSVEALKDVQPVLEAASCEAVEYPDFSSRIQHIHNDFELREVVEDLQCSVLAQQHHEKDAAALTSCALLLAQSRVQNHLYEDEVQLWQEKASIRKLNGLVRKLLSHIQQPMHHLCLDGMRLQDGEFKDIALPFVRLRWADLSHCILTHADLHGGDLRHMHGVGCDMSHIDLHEAWLDGCHLSWADLSHADLRAIQATDMDLSGAFLNGSNLSKAILSGVNFASATLDEANLKGANLFGVCLKLARLHGTNLKYTGITPARLANAGMAVHADQDTIWGSEHDCAGRNPLQVYT